MCRSSSIKFVLQPKLRNLLTLEASSHDYHDAHGVCLNQRSVHVLMECNVHMYDQHERDDQSDASCDGDDDKELVPVLEQGLGQEQVEVLLQ